MHAKHFLGALVVSSLAATGIGLGSEARAAPSIVASQPSYTSGQPIQITFSGGPGQLHGLGGYLPGRLGSGPCEESARRAQPPSDAVDVSETDRTAFRDSSPANTVGRL